MKIKRPDWDALAKGMFSADQKYVGTMALNEWFDEYVEPVNKMLAEGIEVWSDSPMQKSHSDWNTFCEPKHKHKALLINIEPIKGSQCEHEEVRWQVEMKNGVYDQYYICQTCNKKLKPTGWEVTEKGSIGE